MLETAGYAVAAALTARDALAILDSQPIALIIADIAMPTMNGYQFYQRVREHAKWLLIPFMFLTARTLDSDVRYGRELGIDDYLSKPIQPEDLLAAVGGRLRRARQLSEQIERRTEHTTPILHNGPLAIEPQHHRVWLNDQPIVVSSREFLLLEHLVRHASRIVSVCELIQVTHGLETDADEAGVLLRPLIRSVRRKLGYTVGEHGAIENVRGVGYRLAWPQQ